MDDLFGSSTCAVRIYRRRLQPAPDALDPRLSNLRAAHDPTCSLIRGKITRVMLLTEGQMSDYEGVALMFEAKPPASVPLAARDTATFIS